MSKCFNPFAHHIWCENIRFPHGQRKEQVCILVIVEWWNPSTSQVLLGGWQWCQPQRRSHWTGAEEAASAQKQLSRLHWQSAQELKQTHRSYLSAACCSGSSLSLFSYPFILPLQLVLWFSLRCKVYISPSCWSCIAFWTMTQLKKKKWSDVKRFSQLRTAATAGLKSLKLYYSSQK